MVPGGALGGLPATPGITGLPPGDLLAEPGCLLAAPGGSSAALGGLPSTPGASGFLWAASWRVPTVPWRLPAPTGPPPDGTWVTRRLTRTGGSPLSIVVSILVCCLEYVVSFMAEFHEVEFPNHIGRVMGSGKFGSGPIINFPPPLVGEGSLRIFFMHRY